MGDAILRNTAAGRTDWKCMPPFDALEIRPSRLLLGASLVALLAAVAACEEPRRPAKTPHQSPLTARASFDLGCPAPELHYANLGNHVWGVSGCGGRAAYVHRCDQTYSRGIVVDEECEWVLNGAVLRQEPAPSAAPTPSTVSEKDEADAKQDKQDEQE
jgi:hypothetical protein